MWELLSSFRGQEAFRTRKINYLVFSVEDPFLQ